MELCTHNGLPITLEMELRPHNGLPITLEMELCAPNGLPITLEMELCTHNGLPIALEMEFGRPATISNVFQTLMFLSNTDQKCVKMPFSVI